MKGENGTPVTPDWSPEPRPCRRDDCVCETPQHAVFMHGNEDHITRGEN